MILSFGPCVFPNATAPLYDAVAVVAFEAGRGGGGGEVEGGVQFVLHSCISFYLKVTSQTTISKSG